MPYHVSSVRPYISSNRVHCSAVSGVDEQLISRSVGTSLAVMPRGLLSSMLMTVGTPAEHVMPYFCTQPKKRLCENRLATYSGTPFTRDGIRLTICGECQPNER